jgi:hypothetical protein
MIKVFKVSSEAHPKIQSTLRQDPFARANYIYRAASSLGVKGEEYYLYIKATDDKFFKENKESLDVEGVEELKGKNFDEIKEKIEKEQEDVATGIGTFFD